MIAIYLRVSSDKQDEAMQRSAIMQYLNQEGYGAAPVFGKSPTKEYKDFDISGTTTARPSYQELLGNIMDGTISKIIVYEYSRLWRDMQEQSRVLKILETLKIELFSITEGQLKTDEDEFKANILGSANVYEVKRLRRRIKDGIARKKRDIAEGKDIWNGRGKDKKIRKRPIKKTTLKTT